MRRPDPERNNPWPREEDLDSPTDVFQAIEHELRVYRTYKDMQRCIVGLDNLYLNTTFADSIRQHSVNTAAILAMNEEIEFETANLMIYSGSLLGLHTSINNLPIDEKRYIVASGFDIVPFSYESEDDESFRTRCIQTYIDNATDVDDTFQHSLPETAREPIARSAQRMCENAGEVYERYFIHGVMTSIYYTQQFHDEYRAEIAAN